MLDFRCSKVVVLLACLLAGSGTRLEAQIRANGYIDTSFIVPCLNQVTVDYQTWGLLVQGDGKILAGGNYSTGVGACRNAVARFHTTGAIDNSFNPPFNPNDYVTAIAQQSTGKILVAGRLTDFNNGFPVARLNANGTLDSAFQRFTSQPLVANAMVVGAGDKIYVGGTSYVQNQPDGGFVVRMNSNGTLDTSFTNAVITESGLEPTVYALALQSSKVLVGGKFENFFDNGVISNRSGLARMNENGRLDVTFRAPLTNTDVRALLLQPDGRILVAGRFATVGGLDRALTRLNADGTDDSTFASVGTGITGLSLALEPDGRILLGHTLGIMRVTTNGLVDGTFGPTNAPGFFGTDATDVGSVARGVDGHVIVGAKRVGVNGTERRGLARLFSNLPPPPVILVQPATNTVVDAGTNVTLSVIATGAPPLTFQWRRNNSTLSGATSSNLSLIDVDSTDTGDYRVVITNPGGSVTSTVARVQVNFFVSPIAIVASEGGTVSPNLNGRILEIGRAYTFTAKPARGFLFTNWTGSVTSPNPVLVFNMVTNAELYANFVPSPFLPIRGAYTGLFFDTNAPAHATAGDFNLTLDDRGGFKGSLRQGKTPRRFRGTFSLDRIATVEIPATSKLPKLTLDLELDTLNALVHGTVTFGTNGQSSTLFGFRKVFSTRLNPAPNAGQFNTVLEVNEPTEAPIAGDGYVPLTVSTSGRVSGRGVLADGTSWSVVSAMSTNAWVPIYVPLHSGAGSIFGWLTVTNTGANDAEGTLLWTRPAGLRTAIHPGGFTNSVSAIGSRFTRVPRGTNVLNLPNGVLLLAGGNLAEPIAQAFALDGSNKIVGTNGIAVTLSGTKGTLSGSFVDPAVSRKRTVRGLVLQNQNQARGFFLGTNEVGRVWLGE